ncbi:MAG: hypothetical protein Q8Q20_03825 [bacterium]|nr:hypothetical protein [bacterium]
MNSPEVVLMALCAALELRMPPDELTAWAGAFCENLLLGQTPEQVLQLLDSSPDDDDEEARMRWFFESCGKVGIPMAYSKVP